MADRIGDFPAQHFSEGAADAGATAGVAGGRRFPKEQRPGYLFVLPWSFSVLSGGVNQVVLNLARAMQATGSYEPIVLCLDWSATEPAWEEEHGIRTVRLRVRSFDPEMGWKARVAYWAWEKRFRKRFERLRTELQLCAVNLHYVGAVAFTLERLCRLGSSPLPLLLSFHGQDVTDIGKGRTRSIVRWRNCLAGARAAVVCSRDLGEKLVDTVGGPVVPTVIYNGIDGKFLVETAETAPKPVGRRYILNIGRFEWKKGQDILIEAFSEIADHYPDLDLVLVGASDRMLIKLRKLSVRKGLGGRVHFHVDRPHVEIGDFLRNAELLALPSRSEPFGIVLVEAGILGIPVIAAAVGGIPELISDGTTGRLVPSESPAELARGLRSLLDDPDGRRTLGARLREHIATNFTWKMAHDRYRDVVESERDPRIPFSTGKTIESGRAG